MSVDIPEIVQDILREAERYAGKRAMDELSSSSSYQDIVDSIERYLSIHGLKKTLNQVKEDIDDEYLFIKPNRINKEVYKDNDVNYYGQIVVKR